MSLHAYLPYVYLKVPYYLKVGLRHGGPKVCILQTILTQKSKVPTSEGFNPLFHSSLRLLVPYAHSHLR